MKNGKQKFRQQETGETSFNRKEYYEVKKEMINNNYQISKEEHQKLLADIENIEKEMQKREQDHKNNINAFINKHRHLEYDHDIFINQTLISDSKKAVEEEDKLKREREKAFLLQKQKLMGGINDDSNANREQIAKRKTDLHNIFESKKTTLHNSLMKVKHE